MSNANKNHCVYDATDMRILITTYKHSDAILLVSFTDYCAQIMVSNKIAQFKSCQLNIFIIM